MDTVDNAVDVDSAVDVDVQLIDLPASVLQAVCVWSISNIVLTTPTPTKLIISRKKAPCCEGCVQLCIHPSRGIPCVSGTSHMATILAVHNGTRNTMLSIIQDAINLVAMTRGCGGGRLHTMDVRMLGGQIHVDDTHAFPCHFVQSTSAWGRYMATCGHNKTYAADSVQLWDLLQPLHHGPQATAHTNLQEDTCRRGCQCAGQEGEAVECSMCC